MAIKNWTVKTKQIKKKDVGLVNHFNYLKNEQRASHFYTKIVDLNNSDEKLINILNQAEERKKYRQENGLRGGGVSNLATSFVLSLPRDIEQPSPKEWQKMTALALKKLANDVGIDYKKIKDNTVAFLHDESASIDKTSHVHIMVSNVIDGQVIKPISQYQGTYSMKQGFNEAMKNVMKNDHKNYIALNENVGDKPLFAARAEKAENREKEIKAKQNLLLKNFNKMKKILSNEKSSISEEKEQLEQATARFKEVVNFAKGKLNSWIKSLRTNQEGLELKAKETAKVIVDIKQELPEIAEDMLSVASKEEARESIKNELRKEEKITHQVEQEEVKSRKRRRRMR
jgi:hypothetical protein